MNSIQMLRVVASLLLVLGLTGCGGGGGAQPQPPAGPLAPTTTPLTPTSTTLTPTSAGPAAPSTSTVAPVPGGATSTTGVVERSVPLTGQDGTGASTTDIAQIVGAGLVAQLSNPAVSQFRQTIWKNIGAKYGKQANFWALDTDTDPQQAQFLQWRNVNPTVMVTKGKNVVERLENPTEAQISASVEKWLATKVQ